MKKVKLSPDTIVLVVGMSSGDIVLTKIQGKCKVTQTYVLSKIHDFGVNSLDALLCGANIVISSGGDDQQLAVNVVS